MLESEKQEQRSTDSVFKLICLVLRFGCWCGCSRSDKRVPGCHSGRRIIDGRLCHYRSYKDPLLSIEDVVDEEIGLFSTDDIDDAVNGFLD